MKIYAAVIEWPEEASELVIETAPLARYEEVKRLVHDDYAARFDTEWTREALEHLGQIKNASDLHDWTHALYDMDGMPTISIFEREV